MCVMELLLLSGIGLKWENSFMFNCLEQMVFILRIKIDLTGDLYKKALFFTAVQCSGLRK